MRPKKGYPASLDQVRIARKGETAVIEYAESDVMSTSLTIGPKLARMSDQEILDVHNHCLACQEESAATYEHVAVEIPPGMPQIERFERGDHHWVPRGDVLRCQVDDGGPDGEAVIHIDDHELSMHEFGKVLASFAGWGMRIVMVPDDALTEEPVVEVRAPEDAS